MLVSPPSSLTDDEPKVGFEKNWKGLRIGFEKPLGFLIFGEKHKEIVGLGLIL